MDLFLSKNRNVWIVFSTDISTVQGGIYAADNLTQAQFLEILKVAFTANGGFHTYQYRRVTPLSATDEPLPHGFYMLVPVIPGEEVTRRSRSRYYPRVPSFSKNPKDIQFRDEVRQRDGRCVITGVESSKDESGHWDGLAAAHIVPLPLGQVLKKMGFDDVNSPQNGLLLSSHTRRLWDSYSLAVNPSDGYRVQSFRPNSWAYHNKLLSPVCRCPDDPRRVGDVLLRWHFEQAVLCNVRGEIDFPPPTTEPPSETRHAPEDEPFYRLSGLEGVRTRSPGSLWTIPDSPQSV